VFPYHYRQGESDENEPDVPRKDGGTYPVVDMVVHGRIALIELEWFKQVFIVHHIEHIEHITAKIPANNHRICVVVSKVVEVMK
jgi:hypothetical protein